MTSILLLTLLSWLHSHPCAPPPAAALIGSVSLLPVEKVVRSDVTKEAGRVFRGFEMKSLSKLEASNPAGRGVISFPLASKKSVPVIQLSVATDVRIRGRGHIAVELERLVVDRQGVGDHVGTQCDG